MRGETVLVDGVPVENVLVEPGLARDATDIERPLGSTVSYTLRFPIAYEGPIDKAKVTVRGIELDTLNHAEHWRPADVFGSWSGDWDMNVLVGRSLGDFDAYIQVVEKVASIDALGDPVESTNYVYAGAAQARMEGGGESDGEAVMTDVAETWAFVVPWRAAFAEMRPRSAWVVYNGARYDVASVENADNASEYACLKAVHHG